MTPPQNLRLPTPRLRFHLGTLGLVAPLLVFLTGVAWLGLSGAPSERGFWPILIAALTAGMILARDRRAYAETLITGMSRPLVLLMILAWLLAGILAVLMQQSGFVDALVWLAVSSGVDGRGFVLLSFFLHALISTATGTSLGTLILGAPLLYPAAVALGAEPAIAIGALLGGATFGDNISPVSDTTIASSSTQGADLGGVVASRLRYALPAAALALVAYALLAGGGSATAVPRLEADPRALPMLLAPALVLGLLLRGHHLLEGLLFGIAAAVSTGLVLGLFSPAELIHLDRDAFEARGLLVDGIERGVGISIFTLLLMGLIEGLTAGGLLDALVDLARRRARTPRGGELTIFAATSAAVVLTTHSVVAILAVGDLARKTGERLGIDPYRRANLLDVTVCTYPFLLPYCVPTILAASLTAGGDPSLPRVSAFMAGMANFHSWALWLVLVVAILTGFGRSNSTPKDSNLEEDPA